MAGTEVAITQWRQATESFRAETAAMVTRVYFDKLGSAVCPGQTDVAIATDAADAALRAVILSPTTGALLSNASCADGQHAALALKFNAACPKLSIPAPQVSQELPLVRLALAAVVGAIAGAMLLTPAARLLLDMRDLGLVLGAPIGAFVMVFAIGHASKSQWLRRLLMAAVGVSAIAEVWALLSVASFWGQLWRGLRGRRSVLQRLMLYVVIFLILICIKPKVFIDRREYERVVRASIDRWLEMAVMLLGVLGGEPIMAETALADPVLTTLADKVLDLKRHPPDQLAGAVAELIQEMKNMGFDATPDTSDSITWDDSHHHRYDTFGHIEPGDSVTIEREPVVLHGSVRRKGLVRKLRGGG